MADSAPTAQSILSSFLLTSTSYTLPSLATLRSLDPTSRLSDQELKQAHRELLAHRKGLREQLQQNINEYKLLPPNSAPKRSAKEQEEEELQDEGAEVDHLTLQQLIERLEAEEQSLDTEVQELHEAVEDHKTTLDALSRLSLLASMAQLTMSLLRRFADTLAATSKPTPTPPSVKRELEATLGGLERDVKVRFSHCSSAWARITNTLSGNEQKYRGLVDEINERAGK